jgi:hypothetical protein
MPQRSDSLTLVRKLEQNRIVLAARYVGGGKKAVSASPHFFNSEKEASIVASHERDLLG